MKNYALLESYDNQAGRYFVQIMWIEMVSVASLIMGWVLIVVGTAGDLITSHGCGFTLTGLLVYLYAEMIILPKYEEVTKKIKLLLIKGK